jgi:hypothetical protein
MFWFKLVRGQTLKIYFENFFSFFLGDRHLQIVCKGRVDAVVDAFASVWNFVGVDDHTGRDFKDFITILFPLDFKLRLRKPASLRIYGNRAG